MGRTYKGIKGNSNYLQKLLYKNYTRSSEPNGFGVLLYTTKPIANALPKQIIRFGD